MKLTIHYWRGTTHFTGHATTARGAARVCARNQNAYNPRITDEQGRRLHLTWETMPGGKTVPVLWDEEGRPV